MQTFTYGSYLTLGYVAEDKINTLAWIPVTDSDRWVKLRFELFLIF